MVGRSRAVLLTFGFVTSRPATDIALALSNTLSLLSLKNFGTLSQQKAMSAQELVSPLLPSSPISKLIKNKFRLFRVRSPLLAESILFLFLWVLRCFTSPGILPVRQLADRIIAVYAIGFPHSDISGSKPARRLPEA